MCAPWANMQEGALSAKKCWIFDPRENNECILEKLTSFSQKTSSLSSTQSSKSRQSRTTCLEEAEDVDGPPEEQAVAHASKTLTDAGPMRLDAIILLSLIHI